MDCIILCQFCIRILENLKDICKDLRIQKIEKPWFLKSNLAVIEFLLCADHCTRLTEFPPCADHWDKRSK